VKMDVVQLYRRHDPDTSREAAESIVDELTLLQEDVLAYAKDRGPQGFTDHELSKDFHCFGSTYRSRRSELTRLGKIVPTTSRRKMPSGRRAIVWVHKEYDV
jgi:hypothetical protein